MSSGRGGSWTFAGAVVVALLLLDFVDFAQTKVKHTRSQNLIETGICPTAESV